MWSEEDILYHSRLGSSLGCFNDGLPKLIELLKNPNSMPGVYFDENPKRRVCTYSPERDQDELIVENFREGLEKLSKYYFNMNNEFCTEVWASFPIFKREGIEDCGKRFLVAFVQYGMGGKEFRLNFEIGHRKNSYRVKALEFESKFEDIMKNSLKQNIEKIIVK